MADTTLSERITSRLEKLGIKAERACRDARLNRDFIRNILKGKSQNPRRDTLSALARALHTNTQWLADGIGDPEAMPEGGHATAGSEGGGGIRAPDPHIGDPIETEDEVALLSLWRRLSYVQRLEMLSRLVIDDSPASR